MVGGGRDGEVVCRRAVTRETWARARAEERVPMRRVRVWGGGEEERRGEAICGVGWLEEGWVVRGGALGRVGGCSS